MADKTQARFWWLLSLTLVVFVGAMVVTVLMRKPVSPTRLTIKVDTNGNAKLYGVPLLTTNIRDKTFSAMSAMGFKGALAIPPATSTNEELRNNVQDTLKSMSRAGLFGPTNSAPAPSGSPPRPIVSPYE